MYLLAIKFKRPEDSKKSIKRQDNVYTNTESVQCISIVYSICPYKYNQ